MRHGWNEQAVTELVAVTEHVMGLNKVAMGLLIEPDVFHEAPDNRASLIGVASAGALREPAVSILAEIRERERERLGLERIPNVWRVIAQNARYLEATWHKDRVLLTDGALGLSTKLAAALAISMTNGCRYFIEYYTAALRRGGLADAGILEILAVVDHYNCFNKLADGMQIESDIRP